MFYALSEKEMKVIENISEKTGNDYELQGEKIEVTNLLIALSDMLVVNGHLEERIEDILRDRDDNYEQKEINPYTEYGISESEFY